MKRTFLLSGLMIILAGCGGGDGDVAPETEASKASATESASKWTPEQNEALKKALSERRQEEPTAGGQTTPGSSGK